MIFLNEIIHKSKPKRLSFNKQAGIVQHPFLPYDTFSTNLTPEYRYGLPLTVKIGGVVTYIDKILHTKVEVNNDREKLAAYNLSRDPSHSLNDERGYRP